MNTCIQDDLLVDTLHLYGVDDGNMARAFASAEGALQGCLGDLATSCPILFLNLALSKNNTKHQFHRG